MPTYNGSSIVTGVLYENGTIIVKTSIKPEIDVVVIEQASLVSSREKQKIALIAVAETSTILAANLVSSREKQKINTLNLPAIADTESIPTIKVNDGNLVSSRQRTVIVAP